ncbi:MAG: glycosyl transferase family protein [Friedmanniella sp.]|nr:glycosyl transferase family protein [Friedmanniella sp.]
MKAWATLLTQPDYVMGVRALRASLEKAGSPYPLVVMVTAGIDADARRVLEADGCLLREVQPIRPNRDLEDSYANARFAEVWTKLAVWRLTEFERLVVLDADMLAVQNMDELFSLELADDQIAACHACRCNPNKIASYPASWTPDNCAYSHGLGTVGRTGVARARDYLNGGTLVLRPDETVFEGLMAALAAVDDLSRYPFAEQDFLNEHFAGRWVPLAYAYNALKTLPHQHPALWNADEVKNVHYIIDKPWQKPLDPADRYYELNRLWWAVAEEFLGEGDRELVLAEGSA